MLRRNKTPCSQNGPVFGEYDRISRIKFLVADYVIAVCAYFYKFPKSAQCM